MSQKHEKFEARYVAVHREGNPQLKLELFIGKITHTCFRCEGNFPSLIRVKFVSGLVADVCPDCLEVYKQKDTVKHVFGANIKK